MSQERKRESCTVSNPNGDPIKRPPDQREPDSAPPGKNLGKGMLFVAWLGGMALLTMWFGDWEETQFNPNRSPEARFSDDGVPEVMLQRNRQGHYIVNGTANGVPVTFLLDTGATDVAIPEAVAAEIGLQRGARGQARTANGTAPIYATRVHDLKIGSISLYDVNASIVPGMEGNAVLLGMSALGKLDFQQSGNVLTLRQVDSR